MTPEKVGLTSPTSMVLLALTAKLRVNAAAVVGWRVPPLRVIGPDPKLLSPANWTTPPETNVLHPPPAMPDRATVPPSRASGPDPETSDVSTVMRLWMAFGPVPEMAPPAGVRTTG